MPKSWLRCSTNMSHSSNEPGSNRRSSRSRAVSLPLPCCCAMRRSPPPSRAAARFSSNRRRMSCIGLSSGTVGDIISAREAPGNVQRQRSRRADPRAGASAPHPRPIVRSRSLVELGRRERRFGIEPACGKRQRHDERAAQRGREMERRELHRVVRRDSIDKRAERRLRLIRRHDSGRHRKRGAIALARPVDERLPCRMLARHQLRGTFGAIAHKVRAGVFRDFGDDRIAAGRYEVDGDAGDAGERHRVGIDLFALRLPFAGYRLGKRAARHGKRRLRRRAHRPAVEHDGEGAVRFRHSGSAIGAPRPAKHRRRDRRTGRARRPRRSRKRRRSRACAAARALSP